jgi:hypothetical protein
MDNNTTLQRFFLECQHIATEAQFIIDSLPNAEEPAVERILHQLDAIRTILFNLHDPATTEADKENLIAFILHLMAPLQRHLTEPPPPVNASIPRASTSSVGRPAYILDLDRAIGLHQLGNTWEDIATAMGVTRQTLYNHMHEAGLATARRAWSDIDDEQLDELVREISFSHPYVGSKIVLGHLESRGIHLPLLRIQESLNRVDRIGVLVR